MSAIKSLRLAVVLYVCGLASYNSAANILVLVPNGMYSHTHNFMPVVFGLAAKGHNITMVTAFPQKKPVPNVRDIVVPNYMDEIMASAPTTNLRELDGLTFRLFGLWMLGLVGTKKALQGDTIQQLIQDTSSKYDLIITETWFVQEAFVAFGHKYNAPVINLMPSYLFPRAAHLTGNNLPCTYVPISQLGGISDRMTFLERAANCLLYLWDVYVGELYYLKQQEAMMKKYFKYQGSENMPPLMDMLRNTSLTLSDYHFGIGYPMPLHKNVIEFGGTNLKKPEKLPNDFQKFMDSAKDGIIYFSFGSHAKVSFLNPESQMALFKVLSNVKQKVMMKLEDTNPFKDLANENIMIKSWFPQPSIIAHPNCKLFITHGGVHGMLEAINNAVPMLVIPLFGDQASNAKFIQQTGIGYALQSDDITEERLHYAINQVINNPSYKESIQQRSAIFKDTPMNMLDNAIYWVEYVIRHKGAPHLRPAVVDLHWFQYLMLDIIALYLFIITLIMLVLKILVKLLFILIRILFCLRSDQSVNKQKKSKRE